jgi:RimJ/RimL family protein N-acetyltransferase
MNIRLLRTSENDLDFVLIAEQSAENRSFVTVWAREQHLGALASEDLSHLIIENIADGSRVGYIILAGLADANQSIEFRRIVVTEKGKGYGKEALRLVKKLAFEELKAHRLWLDVREHNVRARHVYESEGFVAEGLLRECIKTEVGFDSLIVMSMLFSEYHAAQQGAAPDRPQRASREAQKLPSTGLG